MIGFSPGFIAPVTAHSEPKIFISHGTRDVVSPIDPCSRRIVPLLLQAEYAVTYQECDGAHVIPADVSSLAVNWFLGGA